MPVTDDFWPIYEKYLRTERRAAPGVHAVWIASRKSHGNPFVMRFLIGPALHRSKIKHLDSSAPVPSHPAQGVLDITANIKVAHEILGYSHPSTTARIYLRVDQPAMTALAEMASTERARPQNS